MIFQLFDKSEKVNNNLSPQLQQMLAFGCQNKIKYKTFNDYINICDWVIRRQEYNFIISQVDEFAQKSSEPLKILDIGCGVVPLCNRFSALGHEVTACDPIKGDIDFLLSADINKVYDSNVQYMEVCGESLPFESDSFDVVYMASVLEHVPSGNDLVVIMEALRILKQGGLFVFTTDVVPNDLKAHRHFMKAFDSATIQPILSALSRSCTVDENTIANITSQLDSLTWNDIYEFWKQTRESDNREDDIRRYLAIGLSGTKEHDTVIPEANGKIKLILDGTKNLISDYYALLDDAMQKELVIQQKEQALQELSKSLIEKEAVIQELDMYIKQNIKKS